MSSPRSEPATTARPNDPAGLADRLIAQGLAGREVPDLLACAAEGLIHLGLPLIRLHSSASTLHPIYGAISHTWERSSGDVASNPRPRANYASLPWQQSPFFHMLRQGLSVLRQKLDRKSELEFPIYEEFRAIGGTDYYARMVGFARQGQEQVREGVLYSFVAGGEGGFADGDLELIKRIVPPLSLAIRSIVTQQIAANLLEVYVGRDAGRRVFAGEIVRGQVSALQAVIYLADLRGFTALSQAMPGRELVALLDEYLERMATPVLQGGGEVLKFLGDGLLGVFPVREEGEAERACLAALAAAEEALALTARFNAGRLAAGLPHLELDLVLHRGEVLYGNVGAAGRLDFTVIGPAVNEAGRIEALCGDLGHNLLLSEVFVQAAPAALPRLRPLGRHALRGMPGLHSLYALAPPP